MVGHLCNFLFDRGVGCFHCGKPIGWLRRRFDVDFCSDVHRARYCELLRVALEQLSGSHVIRKRPVAAVSAMTAQTRIRHGWFQERVRRLVREMIRRRAARIACAAAQMIRGLVGASTADVRANIVLDSDPGAPAEIDLVALSGDGVAGTNGSRYGSCDNWLAKMKPMAGTGNPDGHAAEGCLERLQAAHVKTYSTEQGGRAARQPGLDVIAGNIIVEAERGEKAFAVNHNGSQVDKHSAWEESGAEQSPEPTAYAWANRSSVYHYTTCKYVSNIAPANLVHGAQPPVGKKLHQGCPM